MATEDQKQDNSRAEDLNAQLISLAEQLGRMAGTIEGTAESWMKTGNLTQQLTTLRDNANKLLNKVSGNAAGKATNPKNAAAKEKPARRAATAADPAHAPGKKHRKPAPSARGAKKSDQRIAKMRTAQSVRRRTPAR